MSDLLARLILAGTPADLVAEVALAVARAEVAREVAHQDDERQERKRANNAERQRRFKARKQNEVTEGNASNALLTPGNVTDVTSGSLSLPPNENISNPPTHTLPDMNTRARGPWDFHVSAWKVWRETHAFPKPWWADQQVWSDWMDVRRAKKARNTITAHNGFLADIAKHANAEWPPGRLLQHAAARSWLSINRPEEPRHANFKRPANQDLRPSNGHSVDRRSSLARACDEALDWLG